MLGDDILFGYCYPPPLLIQKFACMHFGRFGLLHPFHPSSSPPFPPKRTKLVLKPPQLTLLEVDTSEVACQAEETMPTYPRSYTPTPLREQYLETSSKELGTLKEPHRVRLKPVNFSPNFTHARRRARMGVSSSPRVTQLLECVAGCKDTTTPRFRTPSPLRELIGLQRKRLEERAALPPISSPALLADTLKDPDKQQRMESQRASPPLLTGAPLTPLSGRTRYFPIRTGRKKSQAGSCLL